MCEKGQSLPIDRGKGEMSARCCESSTRADIFRFLGRGEFREPAPGSRNCPIGENRGRGTPRRRNKALRAAGSKTRRRRNPKNKKETAARLCSSPF